MAERIRVVTLVGARPQFIKAAVLSRALRADARFEEVLVHSGQHYDAEMSDIFFEELDIPRPEHHLAVGSGTHGQQTARVLERFEAIVQQAMPAWVVVHGDTNTTLAGALAASKVHVPVAHVEAGLRSGDRSMPEELNRILVDHLSDSLLAPTQRATENLQREGIAPSRIHQVGDVMYDAARIYGARARERSRILEQVGVSPGGYALATVHRAANTDDPRRLRRILTGLAEAARDTPIVFPMHPRTRAAIARAHQGEPLLANIHVIPPVGYLDMLALQMHARVVVTDSGGVQKEAYFHSVPCVTLRDTTEWSETIEGGWNVLADDDPEAIASAIAKAQRGRMGADHYGDGAASGKILDVLARGAKER